VPAGVVGVGVVLVLGFGVWTALLSLLLLGVALRGARSPRSPRPAATGYAAPTAAPA